MSRNSRKPRTERGANIQRDANGKVVTPPFNKISRPDHSATRRKFVRGRPYHNGKLVKPLRYKYHTKGD